MPTRECSRWQIFVVVTILTPLCVFWNGRAVAQSTYDFNGDSMLDCGDIDLISFHIINGTHDAQFDVNEDQLVNSDDLDLLRHAIALDRGFERAVDYDVNLDGRSDYHDANIFAINSFKKVTSWCRSDLDLNGFVDNLDDEMKYNWLESVNNVEAPVAPLQLLELPSQLEAWNNYPDGVTFATVGPFELVAAPTRAPNGLLATRFVVRTPGADHRIATLHGMEFSGDVHQTWLSGPFGAPTAIEVRAGATFHEDWIPYDSHLLIRGRDIGNSFGGGFSFQETNDGSNPAGADADLPEIQFSDRISLTGTSGLGNLGQEYWYSTITLDPTAQMSEIELAYLVTPAEMADGIPGQVFLRMGVLGGDSNDLPLEANGVIGLNEPVSVPFFAEPCDVNSDGFCDSMDLNQILSALGTDQPQLNLDPTNPFIDLGDRDAWLLDASEDGLPILLGDTDMNGVVNAGDLNAVALNWQASGELGWQNGDFDGSQSVDSADLNALGANWQARSREIQTVPEPLAMVLFVQFFFTVFVAPWRRRLTN